MRNFVDNVEQKRYKPINIHSLVDKHVFHEPRFEYNIYIRREQLFFDIDSEMSIVNKARRKEDGSEDDLLSSGSSKYQKLFERWIDHHIGIAKGVMSAFMLEKYRSAKLNSIGDVEEVRITLAMPDWWDETVFGQLSAAVHRYVVDKCLHEYFMLTLTSKDPLTIDKAQQAADDLHDVKKYVNASKPGRIHKILKPF